MGLEKQNRLSNLPLSLSSTLISGLSILLDLWKSSQEQVPWKNSIYFSESTISLRLGNLIVDRLKYSEWEWSDLREKLSLIENINYGLSKESLHVYIDVIKK